MRRSRPGLVGRVASATLTFLVVLMVAARADTGLGRHKKLYAVPTPGRVVIDGKFDDWDLSGQIFMYVVSETSDMQSARFALMYDKDALYLGAIVRDPTPMMNRHDPKVDGDKGWDADACQFRICVDPKLGYPIQIGYGHGDMANRSLKHLILWYYTDRQEPCLQMHESMNYVCPRADWEPFGVVPRDLFEAKYLKMDDGGGYTFEYRIPWTTLGAPEPLKAGDLAPGTVQFNWSRPDGLKTAGGSAWCYDVMAGPGFPYQNTSCWGKIIFSDKGGLAKELVEEGVAPERPLPLKFAYDLPEDGQVTIQLADRDGMVMRILVAQGDRRAGRNVELWDGLTDQGKPMPAGEYTWRGLYHQPIRQKFLFSPHNSGRPPYATDDGTGGWGGDHGNPTTVCSFADGMLLAWSSAEAGWGIIRTDLDGRKKWGSKHCATYLATDGKRFFTAGDHGFDQAAGVKVFDLADGRPLNFGGGTALLRAPDGGEAKANEVTGLAYKDGVLYVAYGGRDLVAQFDAATGAYKGGTNVPAPGRLAARPGEGAGIVAIAKGGLAAIADGKAMPLAADHLDDPRGIAVGPRGAIFVSNGGKLQNVSVFGPRGDYLASIGKEGGRPRVGRYEKDGMLEPGGVALDSRGRLWVAETLDAPKRVSVWDTTTAAFVTEFFGGCDYFGYSYIDPRKPEEIYCHNVLWRIDWNKNTCEPVSTIWRPTTPDMMQQMAPGGYSGHPRFITAKSGRQMAFGNGRFLSILSMRDGDVYKPFAAFIGISRGYVYYGSETQFPLMQDEKKYPNGGYFWQDTNGDQTVQDDEITPIAVLAKALPKIDFRWFQFNIQWCDADMNLWLNGGYRMRPVRLEADGRPVYDLLKIESTFLTGTPQAQGSIWIDPDDGGVYVLAHNQSPSLAKYNAEGKMLWGYPHLLTWPQALGLPMSAPGRLWGLTNPLGVADGFTGNSCYFGTYHIFTTDGLYACMLMRDGRTGGAGPDVTASETLTGQIVKPDGMNRYFLLAGAADARVTEIFGLDTIKRLPGATFTLSEADAKLAADAQSEYAAKLARSKRLSIARGRKALDTADPVSKAYDTARNFTARAAYDEKNLYVLFDVNSPHDLVNAAPDPRTVFKGGNCIDIQIAADPSADPKRKTPAPGDVRLLVTRQQGKPFVVVYRPKIRDFAGEPIVLTSPTGTESFDRIEVTERVGLEYVKTPSGYRAVVTIPLELIGLSLKPGESVRMDLGVIYGNATGTLVAARSYWVNNSFSANVTADVPNESRLEPNEWGTAVVE